MSKKKNALLQVIIYIVILLLIIFAILFFVKHVLTNDENQTIKADMISIQCMAKVYKGERNVNSNISNETSENSGKNNNDTTNLANETAEKKDEFVGEKLSTCNNKIINEFKNKKIIDESEYEKYYVLNDYDLQNLKAYVKNQPNSYYLINYDNYEVIITKGYNGYYKLSDIINLK